MAGIQYPLVGGYAVALRGAPRGILDIDIAVRWEQENLTRAEGALNAAGLVCRTPVSAEYIFHLLDEYRVTIGAASARSRLISVRKPEPLLCAFKTKARPHGTPDQTKMKALMRERFAE